MKQLLLLLLAGSLSLSVLAQDTTLTYKDGDGYRDCLLNGKAVWRHMNAFDPERFNETYKTFHHVFAENGVDMMTKGAGGKFTHHRGLYLGWSKTKTASSGGDFWHCKGVSIRLKEYSADDTSINQWIDKNGKAVVEDHKKVTTTRLDDGSLVMDYDITIRSLDGEVQLNGDPQHAGFQFRAHDGVSTGERGSKKGGCVYTRPESASTKGGDVWTDCPWVVGSFQLDDTSYAVQHMNHPNNPSFDKTVYSTRNYGRFGAYAPHTLSADTPLKFTYRIVISTKPVDQASAQTRYDAWAK